MSSTDLLAIVARYNGLGIEFEPVAKEEVERLRGLLGPMLGQNHAYFLFLLSTGILAIDGPYGMLRPSEVLEACRDQQTFYDGGSFGDTPEDVQSMEREQAFRSTLVPFQYAHSKGDFYCFVSSNRPAGEGDPLSRSRRARDSSTTSTPPS